MLFYVEIGVLSALICLCYYLKYIKGWFEGRVRNVNVPVMLTLGSLGSFVHTELSLEGFILIALYEILFEAWGQYRKVQREPEGEFVPKHIQFSRKREDA